MYKKYSSILLFFTYTFLLTSCGKSSPDVILDRDQFIGNYSGSESCENSTPSLFNVGIEKHATNQDKVILKDFDDLGINIEATVENKALTYTYNQGGFALGGTGNIEGDTLTLTYSKGLGGSSDTCTAISSKTP